jgi:Na+-translocating ferredoxin:NAD+ oxidoreductase RnfC subunit
MRLASYGHTGEKPDRAGEVFLCCECGLCEQACVMGLQPWRLNHELKGRLGPAVAKEFKKAAPSATNRFRDLRRYPIPRLVQKLGLGDYDRQNAPLTPYPQKAQEVRLMLKQHLGAPCQPTVSIGDQVKVGDVVAQPAQGAMGAIIHASIEGFIVRIDKDSVTISKTHTSA